MPNVNITSSMVVRECLMHFKNALGFTKGVNRQYDDYFAKKGAKIGDRINVRLPHNFEVMDGAALQLQDVTDRTVPLILSKRKQVSFTFSTQELSLDIDDFSQRYLKPAGVALANKVDVDGQGEVLNCHQSVGTPGTSPTSLETYLSAGEKLNDMACPQDNRTMLINPRMSTKIVGSLLSLHESSRQIKEQYEEGVMSRAAGFDWRMSQNVRRHITGPLGGTPLVDGASQSGSSIDTKGWTTAAANRLKAGDVISFTGCYAVNPVTKEQTDNLAEFVVTEDFDSDASGEGEISISPPIVLDGPYRNVSAAPGHEAPILIFGHASSYANKVSAAGVAFHKDAFILGCADLYVPRGVDMGSVMSDPESGLSIRFVRAYDKDTDEMVSRLDILYGWLLARPEWACRVQG